MAGHNTEANSCDFDLALSYFTGSVILSLIILGNGDDDDGIGDEDYYKIFIDHRFRYSQLYSVLGVFTTTLLQVKKAIHFSLGTQDVLLECAFVKSHIL